MGEGGGGLGKCFKSIIDWGGGSGLRGIWHRLMNNDGNWMIIIRLHVQLYNSFHFGSADDGSVFS